MNDLNIEDYRTDLLWLLDQADGLGGEGDPLLRSLWFQRNRTPKAAETYERLLGLFADADRNLQPEQIEELEKLVQHRLLRR